MSYALRFTFYPVAVYFQPPTNEVRTMSNIYGRLTGRKRWAIILIGAMSGIVVDMIFAWFSGRMVGPGDLLIGAVIGGLLGLSASLGEKRRK